MRAERAASGQAREDQKPDLVAVVAGDDGILDHRRAGGDGGDTQRADRNPGAGAELEVLADAAVEFEAARRRRRIREPHRVAGAVEPVFVERGAGEFGLAPVTGRDVGAAHADFEPVALGHELHRAPRQRQADIAGALERVVDMRRRRRGLGRAPGRHEYRKPAGRRQRCGLDPLPQALRQRGAGIAQEIEIGEERARQRRIALEPVEHQGKAARHVEIKRRRDGAQILDRALDQSGHRLAVIDPQRAAIEQDEIEIVVAAEGVAPRQPVQHAPADGPRESARPGAPPPGSSTACAAC